MQNRHAPPPILPRPSRCKRCGGAIVWNTAVIEGRRVDTYYCLMCGEEQDEEAIERRRGCAQ